MPKRRNAKSKIFWSSTKLTQNIEKIENQIENLTDLPRCHENKIGFLISIWQHLQAKKYQI